MASVIIEGCAEGCFSVLFEVIAQVVVVVFYYAIIVPIGSIGRMLPASSYHRHISTHTSELGQPYNWGIAGLILLGMAGVVAYAVGSGVGLLALLIPAAIIILLGWLGVWERAKSPRRKKAPPKVSKPEQPRRERPEVPSFQAHSAEVPRAEVPTPRSIIEQKEKKRE